MVAKKNPGRRVFVVGVGMTPFTKPKKDPKEGPFFTTLGVEAVERALEDACIKDERSLVESACVGSMFTLGAGQRVLYDCGLYNIPTFNVNNACATGSNALAIARQNVASGMADCALALGVEVMRPGSLGGGEANGPTSLDHHYKVLNDNYGLTKDPPMAQFFGRAGEEHMKLYGTKPEHFAMIGEKNHRHSRNNPYSQFRDVYSLEQIQSSPKVCGPLTKLQCSPTSNGAACAILASEDFVIKHGLQGQAIELVAQSVHSDSPEVFKSAEGKALIEAVGKSMAQKAAQDAYAEAGLTPDDVNVVELHDCFSCNELITYESLGLAKEGEGGKLIESGNATFGGKYVINPSGGLISKGHPLGATGVAQCAELCWQLRGECGPRQVPGAKVGLQHNLGLGGLVVIGLYRKPEEWVSIPPKRKQSLACGAESSKL
ncbi:Non-specific lipid-transfer protein [Hondaea fermentalgiana]|uniref:propanoyl-CoA C-acyltransferase n=1 Tax=Hondaea fermentalgiana TaxID=2315210 RepID=A0A2R5GX74_9STRA|nr:Non-specific lipid-transfer protein [Hondaea fermentalgiana]|eukprot:GBG34378.1 Non-specific lipid-transfer protein [Hondaea fermentalgiana]